MVARNVSPLVFKRTQKRSNPLRHCTCLHLKSRNVSFAVNMVSPLSTTNARGRKPSIAKASWQRSSSFLVAPYLRSLKSTLCTSAKDQFMAGGVLSSYVAPRFRYLVVPGFEDLAGPPAIPRHVDARYPFWFRAFVFFFPSSPSSSGQAFSMECRPGRSHNLLTSCYKFRSPLETKRRGSTSLKQFRAAVSHHFPKPPARGALRASLAAANFGPFY